MGIVETLIASQRRPDGEALRIATAAQDSIATIEPGQDSEVAAAVQAWAETAAKAAEEANAAIAEEKQPRRTPAAPAHLEQFLDSDATAGHIGGFDDDAGIPVESATHRCDSRFVMTDEEFTDSDTEPAIPTAAGTPPWEVDTTETGEVARTAASPPTEPAQWQAHTAEDYGHGEPSDPDADDGTSLPDEHAQRSDGDGDGDGVTVDDEGDYDEASTDIHLPEQDREDPSRPRRARWGRPFAASPWGDDPEVFTVPDDDLPEPEPAPPLDVDPEPDPTPSEHATAPPDSFDEPEPQPQASVFARLGEAVSPRRLTEKFRGAGSPAKLAVSATAALALISIVVASFTLTGRGKPPEPAGQVAPPPAQIDTAPPPARDEVLIPARVSASCGNDSDAVAPFASDRTRAWVCRRINGLDLNVLNISFACPVVVTSITVTPGFAFVHPDGRDEWVRHRLVTGISWRMGGAVYPQQIVPTRTGVTMQVPNVITQEMSATITSSMRPPMGESSSDGFGSKGDEPAKVDEHSAISSIKIMGHPVDPGSGLCGARG